MSDQTTGTNPEENLEKPYDQKEETAKAIQFMIVKAAIFILIPVIASILAIVFLL